MRIAILCSSPYSETGCAVTARLAQLGYVPVGALTLPSWDRGTLSRKFGQWGLHDSKASAEPLSRESTAARRRSIPQLAAGRPYLWVSGRDVRRSELTTCRSVPKAVVPRFADFHRRKHPARPGAEGSPSWRFELTSCPAPRNPRHEQSGMVAPVWSSPWHNDSFHR